MNSIENNPGQNHVDILRHLNVGETITLNGHECRVQKIESGSELGNQFGLHINRDVPVYILESETVDVQGGYQPEADVVVIYTHNIDPTTLEHELIHAVEFKYEPTPSLLALYEKAKIAITESSFDDVGFITFNFMKNIHEFIADGKTKLKKILKKEGLWEDFQKETAYIFS